MKTLFKNLYTKILILAILIIAIGAVLYWFYCSTNIKIGSNDKIDKTIQYISEVKKLGQWEFLTIVDEVVVDTIRHNRFMPDDRLTLIYQGTLRLGIDFDRVKEDWVDQHSDTLIVKLPKPSLLDDRFIDEAATRVFYERGSWGASAREAMYRRAFRTMINNNVSPENLQKVKFLAQDRFEDLFMSLGAKKVIIDFDN